MSLYAWIHPSERSLVVIQDDEGMFFGFDKRFSQTFSAMTHSLEEAKRWCHRRFAEQN